MTNNPQLTKEQSVAIHETTDKGSAIAKQLASMFTESIIKTDEEFERAMNADHLLKEYRDHIKAQKEKLSTPLRRHATLIDKEIDSAAAPAFEAEEKIKQLIIDYRKLQRRRQEEEQQRLAKEAASSTSPIPEYFTLMAPPVQKTIETSSGKTGFRWECDIVITDISKIPRWLNIGAEAVNLWILDEKLIKDLAKKKIVKTGTIPGVKVDWHEIPVRGRR